MNDPETALIAEQLMHTIDLLRAELAALQAEQAHTQEMGERRFEFLERAAQDHETRLRTVADGVTQFKVLAGLATGGGLVSLITLLRSLLGIR
ncbi:MAG TPA: hypothetical protein VF498_06415 [Anaerolineales bacterium]